VEQLVCKGCGRLMEPASTMYREDRAENVTRVTVQALKCPKCGRPLFEAYDPSPPERVPNHYYFCIDCDVDVVFPLKNVTHVTWVVAWDLPSSVGSAARKRFYRWLRGATEDEPKVRRPLASLVEVDDYSLAQAIVNQVEGAGGTARLYRAQTRARRDEV